ncbi:MAG: phage portal protein, partial [Oscillospiraceae bacterium]
MEFLRDLFGVKDTVYLTERMETAEKQLNLEQLAIDMAINLIASVIARCEFKTFIRGKEIKGEEYHLWNVRPNVNQNSNEFLQKLISKLLYCNEALVVEVAGQLVIADSFSQESYAVRPNTFSDVQCGELTLNKEFLMPEVMYFRLNNKDITALLQSVTEGYSRLLNMAYGKYKRAGGRKGKVTTNGGRSGDQKYQENLDNLFNKQFKNYFENENAVVHMPRDVEYTEISGEGSKRSTSEIADIVSITREVISRVCQAFRIPPALMLGEIADIANVTTNFLTFCIQPLVDLLATEANGKRFPMAEFLKGSYIAVDTTCIKHIDVFDIAEKIDKLIANGVYSVDELRIKIGESPLNEPWSIKHWITRNYEDATKGG